jgi:hypothetical protein
MVITIVLPYLAKVTFITGLPSYGTPESWIAGVFIVIIALLIGVVVMRFAIDKPLRGDNNRRMARVGAAMVYLGAPAAVLMGSWAAVVCLTSMCLIGLLMLGYLIGIMIWLAFRAAKAGTLMAFAKPEATG